MENYYPTQIKKIDNTALRVQWSDGKVSEIALTKLRDECPCANCKGESVLFESYIPIKTPFKAAGYYEIDKIEVVGNYAISIKWKDGHDTGIYSWDILRKL
ncbi:MAG: DUF971 domain-containing protein [Bacteroidetes bacterium]|nr:DUF971 domain-containing protein [Bacteroidota bacterium]